jgi:GT2 family glycosyltransferase
MREPAADKIYIIIVNWNGWQDTIECLESVLRIDYPDYAIIVCDNGSQDGSLEKIKAWAAGNMPITGAAPHPLSSLTRPQIAKPVRYREYEKSGAETGGTPGAEERLVLVRNRVNLGFAGGNNVGLRYALSRNDFGYVWLLNNDTVVRPDALRCLVRKMRERHDAGMCGSTIPYYDTPDRIWALAGGRYNPWSATSTNIGHGLSIRNLLQTDRVEAELDYLAGASMLVSRAFLADVGLLCEDYFLYYEEPDWALRARGKYTIAYAPDSIVYHKVGASTAALNLKGFSRDSSVWHAMRSHLRFTAAFFPWLLPVAAVKRGVQLLLLFIKYGILRGISRMNKNKEH